MKKILVVDDDPYLVDILFYRLKLNGYQVVSAKDGAEALAKVRDLKPDLVVLDMSMPVMDGFQVVKEIKEEETMKNIPIVVVSGRVEDRTKVFEMGVKRFIAKPYEAKNLVATIEQYIK